MDLKPPAHCEVICAALPPSIDTYPAFSSRIYQKQLDPFLPEFDLYPPTEFSKPTALNISTYVSEHRHASVIHKTS